MGFELLVEDRDDSFWRGWVWVFGVVGGESKRNYRLKVGAWGVLSGGCVY